MFIKYILDNLDEIDGALLEDLERRLARAEQELKDADLENRMGSLKNIREDQNRWMRDYDDEIEKLRRDVANIADIRSSLPDGCYRRVKLEP
jgi:coxsackievirus/adenovirus receptor